jgi:hypothetical protein
LAIIPIFGWELGSAESVGVTVCVGFAVDYVVHLASFLFGQQDKNLIHQAMSYMRPNTFFQ